MTPHDVSYKDYRTNCRILTETEVLIIAVVLNVIHFE
jgi:hypothetical protein